MAGSRGQETKSSLSKAQRPVAEAMFEIFKSNLGRELPAFPGSGAIDPFTPQQARQDFRQFVGDPMNTFAQEQLLPLLRPGVRGLAQEQFGESLAGLGSRAARAAEGSALTEFLRTRPETGQAMQLAQGFIGQPQLFGFTAPTRDAEIAAIMSLGAQGAFIGGAALGRPNVQSGAVGLSPSAAEAGRREFFQEFPTRRPNPFA